MVSVLQLISDGFRIAHALGILGDRRCHAHHVAFLRSDLANLVVLRDQFLFHLTADHHQRNRIDPRRRQRRYRIGAAGTGGDQASSHAVGDARIALRRDSTGLLMIVAVVAHILAAGQRVQQVHDSAARNQECVPDTLLGQKLNYIVGKEHSLFPQGEPLSRSLAFCEANRQPRSRLLRSHPPSPATRRERAIPCWCRYAYRKPSGSGLPAGCGWSFHHGCTGMITKRSSSSTAIARLIFGEQHFMQLFAGADPDHLNFAVRRDRRSQIQHLHARDLGNQDLSADHGLNGTQHKPDALLERDPEPGHSADP